MRLLQPERDDMRAAKFGASRPDCTIDYLATCENSNCVVITPAKAEDVDQGPTLWIFIGNAPRTLHTCAKHWHTVIESHSDGFIQRSHEELDLARVIRQAFEAHELTVAEDHIRGLVLDLNEGLIDDKQGPSHLSDFDVEAWLHGIEDRAKSGTYGTTHGHDVTDLIEAVRTLRRGAQEALEITARMDGKLSRFLDEDTIVGVDLGVGPDVSIQQVVEVENGRVLSEKVVPPSAGIWKYPGTLPGGETQDPDPPDDHDLDTGDLDPRPA